MFAPLSCFLSLAYALLPHQHPPPRPSQSPQKKTTSAMPVVFIYAK
jgi:hypothetical protein